MEESEQIEALKYENETLKKQNEELQQKVKAIELKQTNDELEQLRKKVAIEEMATEARKKLFAGVLALGTAIGIASVAGIWKIYDTAVSTIEKKLREPQTFSRIEKQVTDQAKKDVPAQVVNDVSRNLIEDFKKNQKFQQDLTNAAADKILKDPEFSGRIYAIASSAANSSIQEVAQQAPNSAFSNAADKALSQRKYFVVAASSTDSNSLSDLINHANSLGLKAHICSPKKGNGRSVLLVTNTASVELPIDAARTVENKARNIDPTAYTLPTEPAENVFFDPGKCK